MDCMLGLELFVRVIISNSKYKGDLGQSSGQTAVIILNNEHWKLLVWLYTS